jgi:hypothetical protein
LLLIGWQSHHGILDLGKTHGQRLTHGRVPDKSEARTVPKAADAAQPLMNTGDCRVLAFPVTPGQKPEKIGATGFEPATSWSQRKKGHFWHHFAENGMARHIAASMT